MIRRKVPWTRAGGTAAGDSRGKWNYVSSRRSLHRFSCSHRARQMNLCQERAVDISSDGNSLSLPTEEMSLLHLRWDLEGSRLYTLLG